MTDFAGWLDEADPGNFEEVYDLYKATENVEETGKYECQASTDNTKWFVKAGHSDNILMLSSQKTREAFLSLIHSRYCDPKMDIESWYRNNKNMAKID